MVSFVPPVPKASLLRLMRGVDSGAERDGAGALCMDGEFTGDVELGANVRDGSLGVDVCDAVLGMLGADGAGDECMAGAGLGAGAGVLELLLEL